MSTQISKKIIGGGLLVLITLGSVLCFTLSQPKFIARTVRYIFHKTSSEIILKEITIESLNWISWNQLKLKNVRIKCKFKASSYFFSIGEIDLNHLNGIIDQKPLKCRIKNLALVSDLINISDGAIESMIYFKNLSFKEAQGDWDALSIELDQYALNKIKGHFKINTTQIDIHDIFSDFYKGIIKGKIIFEYKPKINYEISLKLKDVDLQELSYVNPAVFEHMKGVFAGEVLINATEHLIKDLNINLNALGGHISSRTLKVLAEVLPKGIIFRQPLDRVIQTQNSINFETGALSIGSNGLEKYKAKVNIYSSKAAIDLRYTYDINIPGGLSEILKFLKLIQG